MTRALVEGTGPVVVLLHGGALGCSADDWRDALAPIAAAGFRALAFDQPGFGECDESPDISLSFRGRFVLGVLDVLGSERATLVGHSQAGRLVVSAALDTPARVAAAVVLCTGSLLPPLSVSGVDAAVPIREPTAAETRAQLEASVFNRACISNEIVERYQRFGTGRNFEYALRRPAEPASAATRPAWGRLADVSAPLMLVYGANDVGQVTERVALARVRYPQLPIHLLERCGHFAQWDQLETVVGLIIGFARS
jgi:pimeloyl-ACP methyl ester carboxylesterase